MRYPKNIQSYKKVFSFHNHYNWAPFHTLSDMSLKSIICLTVLKVGMRRNAEKRFETLYNQAPYEVYDLFGRLGTLDNGRL